MDKLKKNLQTIYSEVAVPKASPNEFQKILAKSRSSIPTKIDKINFSIIFASMIFAVIFLSPRESYVEKTQQEKQMYIYNFSDAFDPN